MAIKLSLLLSLTLLFSHAQTSKCAQKFKLSSFSVENIKAFAVSEDFAIFYSSKNIDVPYIKHDPFLGLYLIKTPKKMKHYFEIVPHRPKELRFVSSQIEGHGKITKHQIGLNSLASFSASGVKSALITASCCQLNAIMTTPHHVIERDYIEYFLHQNTKYGDVGIRLKDGESYPVVEVSNPFFPNNPFKEDDKIIKINGKLVGDAASLMKKILFLGADVDYEFEVIRDNERFVLNVVSKERQGGGLLNDSFLEPFGIILDKNLKVKFLKKGSKIDKLGVRIGDRLMRIGKHNINSPSQIRLALSAEQSLKNKKILILFERKNFQFFIQIAKQSNMGTSKSLF